MTPTFSNDKNTFQSINNLSNNHIINIKIATLLVPTYQTPQGIVGKVVQGVENL